MSHPTLQDALKLAQTGSQDEALLILSRLEADPALRGEAAFYSGSIHNAGRRHEKAIAAFQRSVEASPHVPSAWNNLGVSLRIVGDLRGAVQAFREALHLDPNGAEARSNLGGTLHDLGDFEAGIRELKGAVAAAPNLFEAKGSLGLAMLLHGEFREGWRMYEERLWLKPKSQAALPFPLWDGRPLNGVPIFLRCEQGFGDSIQFVRYARYVESRGGKVVVGATPELQRLLRTVPGVMQVAVPGVSIPTCAAQCPLMSLPRLFDTVLETIPATRQYLFADPPEVALWGDRINSSLQHVASVCCKRIGLVWAGAAHNKHDRRRSIPLSSWSGLAKVPNVQLFSLQKGTASDPIGPAGLQIIDWTSDLHDFADTAALISNLDLVITVDTAVAHLAGALGKPVWVLIHYSPDWRWMLGRSDSPWYPSMRLFRQPTPGDWDSAIRDIEKALREFVQVPSDNQA